MGSLGSNLKMRSLLCEGLKSSDSYKLKFCRLKQFIPMKFPKNSTFHLAELQFLDGLEVDDNLLQCHTSIHPSVSYTHFLLPSGSLHVMLHFLKNQHTLLTARTAVYSPTD